MKMCLDADERYPAYSLYLNDPGPAQVEVTTEEYAEYVRVCDSFNRTQAWLAKLWKERHKK